MLPELRRLKIFYMKNQSVTEAKREMYFTEKNTYQPFHLQGRTPASYET